MFTRIDDIVNRLSASQTRQLNWILLVGAELSWITWVGAHYSAYIFDKIKLRSWYIQNILEWTVRLANKFSYLHVNMCDQTK